MGAPEASRQTAHDPTVPAGSGKGAAVGTRAGIQVAGDRAEEVTPAAVVMAAEAGAGVPVEVLPAAEEPLAVGAGTAAAVAAESRQEGNDAGLERVQVRDEIVQLPGIESASSGGHHVAAVEYGLADKSFVGRPAAG
jgi:hypothetical protein